jgi:4-amino-4-deoxy-L-arabinose transferase-like glycosyltransferase
MDTKPLNANLPQRALQITWPVGLALVFLAIMGLFYPFRQQFEFSRDEGVNLMKAMMVAEGYSLYEQIWSDQPPLFTYWLAGAFELAGFKVNVARLVVLILSTVLVWASVEFLRQAGGTLHALAGFLMLLLLPKYLELSVSVMVGLPALAFATASLAALALWHRQRKTAWLAVSAIALGISILTKAFTGFLVPIFFLGIIIGEYNLFRGKRTFQGLIRPALLWLGIFVGFSVFFGLILIRPGNLPQLIEPHLSTAAIEEFQINKYTLAWNLREARLILFLAVVGAGFSIAQRRWLALYPFAWMGTAATLLFRHIPVWYHQQLLVTIPAALLAAMAVGETINWIYQAVRLRRFSGVPAILAIISIMIFARVWMTEAPISYNQFKTKPSFREVDLKLSREKIEFLWLMNDYAPQTHWVVTDTPMYAFRARLPVPPNLAAFTSKRVQTGNLTEGELFETMRAYQPEQVMMGRFDFPELQSYLNARYNLLLDQLDMRLYIRKDLYPYPLVSGDDAN